MNVGIIGTGKVAHKLAFALDTLDGVSLKAIFGRSESKAKSIVESTDALYYSDLDSLPSLDILIIAIKDDAIKEVSKRIPHSSTLVVHTSGVKNIDVLKDHENRGIFYPLYSFYDKKAQDLLDIPFLIEANSEQNTKILYSLGKKISGNVHLINSSDKKKLHLAAVFANNFSNFMMTTAMDILEKNDIDKEILLPIIRQSCENWSQGLAKENQSGPAIRKDKKTMNAHLELLNSKDQKELYNIISEAIIKYYS